MTNETALRAKKLLENIAALKNYRDTVARSLREEFLPISTKDFMFMYLSKVDEQIKSLEKELEAL